MQFVVEDIVRLYVRPGAQGAMKGTVDNPFDSVNSALIYAQTKTIPAVELQVAAGVYGPEAVMITRHTRLVGPGRNRDLTAKLALSISNAGPLSWAFKAWSSRPVRSGLLSPFRMRELRLRSAMSDSRASLVTAYRRAEAR